MRNRKAISTLGLAAAALLAGIAVAQTPPVAPPAAAPAAGQGRQQMAPIGVPVAGMPFMHDPSTVVHFGGKYWVFATSRGAPFYSSPDGVTWTREGSVFNPPETPAADGYQGAIPEDVHAGVPKNNGSDVWAPDIIRMNGQFYLYYAVSSWGDFQSAIGLATNPVLDPKDPAYKWTSRGIVVSSNGKEDLNAIDPGVIQAPDGTLWICYGSYHGSIRITQLDPKTGLALNPGKLGAPLATANQSEATDIIFHDGFYYLFVNHNSCCKGRQSEYNIRVGRSKTILGPYLDKRGNPMAQGGGSLFLAAHDHRIGPGHFGLLRDYDKETPDAPGGTEGSEAVGAERFSLHYEADTVRGGRSVLDIRPLLWSLDGWPVAGDNIGDGTYQIVARQSENTLESHVPTAPPPPPPPGTPAPRGPVMDVPGTPTGPAAPRLWRYLTLDSQKWTIAPVANGFYKIVSAGSGDALSAGPAKPDVPLLTVTLKPYTGDDSQLWHLDQFPDGGWRIRNKTGLSLTESGSSVLLTPFVRDDLHLWTISTP